MTVSIVYSRGEMKVNGASDPIRRPCHPTMRVRFNPTQPQLLPVYVPRSSGSSTFVAASEVVVGHQAQLQQALTRNGEQP